MPTDIMDLPASPSAGVDPSSGGYDGAPGSIDQRSVDINSNDPLVNLGLVDPASGRALPTDDWRPEPAQTSQPAPAQAQPGQTAQGATAGPAAGVSAPASDVGQQLASVQSQLQVMAANAYAQAVASGADPNIARALIGAKLSEENAKAVLAARENATLPAAKQMAAEHIATQHGNGAVKAADLMGYDSPNAMITAAQQLAQARRSTSYTQRRAAGVDRAEGTSAPAGINPAIAGLSPAQKIELGIRRGQYS